mgnify:CR=1 FL=1
MQDSPEKPEFEERVIEINRVARTVKGGRRIRFRAVVVIGNHQGSVGIGVAKAAEVQAAVKKAFTQAKRSLFSIPLHAGTIPHPTTGFFSGVTVMLKPARAGTSVIAGGPVRAIAEVAGIKNIITKSMGSSNKLNTIRATQQALLSFRPEKSRIAYQNPTQRVTVKAKNQKQKEEKHESNRASKKTNKK